MNTAWTETIRENLTPAQVLAIRQQERAAGHLVNVKRLHSKLVEIEIIHPGNVIDVNPQPITLKGGVTPRYLT